MDTSTGRMSGGEEARSESERRQAADPEAMEMCPNCGTEYCAGCNNARRPEGECPTCGKALIEKRP